MWFYGKHEHVIDAKGRLAIPADMRGASDAEVHGDVFVAVTDPDGALCLYPEHTFHAVAQLMIGKLGPGSERSFFSRAKRVPLDSAKRIRLPDSLMKEHGLSEKVVILGIGDHLELLDPKRWKQQRAAEAPMSSELWHRSRQEVASQQQKQQLQRQQRQDEER